MGRELKRVPLDFAWPIGKTWEGYLNPEGGPCPADGKDCFSGYTAAGKWLESVSRLISMLGEQAAEFGRPKNPNCIYPHPYLQEWAQAPRHGMPRDVITKIRENPDQRERMLLHWEYVSKNPAELLPLTPELRKLCEGLAGRKIDGGFGSGVSYQVAEALKKASGVDDKWGECRICDGHGDDPAKRQAAEDWQKIEPPTGDGFQLWETTSEGSPSSPVFASLAELCDWCATNATTFASFKASAEKWREMLDENFVSHTEGNITFI